MWGRKFWTLLYFLIIGVAVQSAIRMLIDTPKIFLNFCLILIGIIWAVCTVISAHDSEKRKEGSDE